MTDTAGSRDRRSRSRRGLTVWIAEHDRRHGDPDSTRRPGGSSATIDVGERPEDVAVGAEGVWVTSRTG